MDRTGRGQDTSVREREAVPYGKRAAMRVSLKKQMLPAYICPHASIQHLCLHPVRPHMLQIRQAPTAPGSKQHSFWLRMKTKHSRNKQNTNKIPFLARPLYPRLLPFLTTRQPRPPASTCSAKLGGAQLSALGKPKSEMASLRHVSTRYEVYVPYFRAFSRRVCVCMYVPGRARSVSHASKNSMICTGVSFASVSSSAGSISRSTSMNVR